ncbi:MAG: hypothetical protein M1457_04530 [bacterium]|nr:hypothetical protein [bacterium]
MATARRIHVLLVICATLLAGLAASRPRPASAQRPLPPPEEIARMREELQSRQRERLARRQAAELIPWQPAAPSADLTVPPGAGVVRIVNGMDRLRAVLEFAPAGDDAATTRPAQAGAATGAGTGLDRVAATTALRLPLGPRGEQFLPLAAGSWRVRILCGDPAVGALHGLPELHATIRRAMQYDMVLDERFENALKAALRAEARSADREKRENAAGGNESTRSGDGRDNAGPDR